MSEPKKVYKAIVEVQKALAKEGIAKDKTCTQGMTYKFRGIDDVYNALAPYLAEAKLCILPRMLDRDVVERVSSKGGALFYTTVTAEFDFVSAEDGSLHTVGPMYGEAMDSGDKGTNKAMSAAYKYAAFQAFCIPTEGDNDTENQTHEVKPLAQKTQQPQSPPPKAPSNQATPGQSEKLKNLLLEWCSGDIEMAKINLSEISGFDKDNKHHALNWDTLETSSAKWVGGVIGKVQTKIDAGEEPTPF